MERVDERSYRQALEGHRRGDVGPFTCNNHYRGSDTDIEYLDGRTVVMCMHVESCNRPEGKADTSACRRTYYATQAIIDACAYIYIPTDEEAAEWDDMDTETGTDYTAAMIAEREAER